MKFKIGFLVLTIGIPGCGPTKHVGEPNLIIGHWKPNSDTVLNPDLYITRDNYNSVKKYFIASEGDTLNFGYKLKGSIFFIYTGNLLLASKNKILKLNNEILIYRRMGDGEIFSYTRAN